MSLEAYEAFIGPDPEWEVTGTIAGFDPLPRLGGLAAPVLVVTGRWDGLTTPRIAHLTWQSLGPERAHFEVLEASAHRPWAEEPDEYFALLGEYLGGCGC
jgi:proline iminopeptidase